MNYLNFDFLNFDEVRHAFTLRQEKQVDVADLVKLGFPEKSFVFAEQIHSDIAVCVGKEDCGKIIAGADGLITRERGVTLVIRTADCCPIFIFDSEKKAIGLVHSGKKGTQLDILTKTIGKMNSCFGSEAKNLRVLLGPCIRPPHYDMNIAEEIKKQAQKAGVVFLHDCEENTGADLKRFYSYRVEKGQTGRHFSVLALN